MDGILKLNFTWLLQRLVSLSFKKTTVQINLLEFFLEIDVCVILFDDFIRYLTFSHHTIQNIDSHAERLLTILCVVYAAMV